jgi:uncharacterized protein YjbJ (UPF0337 family)
MRGNHWTYRKETNMGLGKRIRGRRRELRGKIEQGIGVATGNEWLENQGKKDRAVGKLKRSGGKAKDAFEK